MILSPPKRSFRRKTRKTKEKLAAYKAKLSKEEITNLIKETENLRKRQITPDDPKDIENTYTFFRRHKKEAEN